MIDLIGLHDILTELEGVRDTIQDILAEAHAELEIAEETMYDGTHETADFLTRMHESEVCLGITPEPCTRCSNPTNVERTFELREDDFTNDVAWVTYRSQIRELERQIVHLAIKLSEYEEDPIIEDGADPEMELQLHRLALLEALCPDGPNLDGPDWLHEGDTVSMHARNLWHALMEDCARFERERGY